MSDELAVVEKSDDPVDDVRAAIAQLEGKTEQPETPEIETEVEAAPQTDAERDEKGRFVKKTGEAPQTAAPEETPATVDNTEAKVATAQPVVSPPTSWSPEAKAQWASLSPALQQAVLKREKEVSDGFAQKSTELRQWKEIESVVAPRRGTFQKFGFKSDAEAVNHLLTLSDSMERDPAGTIFHLARHYGVDLSQIQSGAVQPPQVTPQLPDFDRLVSDHMDLAFARREVSDFEQDKSYPHLTELRPLMAQMLTNGQATDLPSAYEAAMWATPHLRQEAIANLQKSQAQTSVNVKTERAAKAKQATRASITGIPQGSPAKASALVNPKNAFDDVAADVRAAMEQHAG